MPALPSQPEPGSLPAGLNVLHYDADFERVEAVGGAEQEWVAPRGSL